jgi:hypothetical protein
VPSGAVFEDVTARETGVAPVCKFRTESGIMQSEVVPVPVQLVVAGVPTVAVDGTYSL